jgi:hypothetical protein
LCTMEPLTPMSHELAMAAWDYDEEYYAHEH